MWNDTTISEANDQMLNLNLFEIYIEHEHYREHKI